MKKKKKSDITQVVSKSPYKTVKTSLKSILLNYNDIQPEINKLVIKCNDIVVQTYQFIRLYFLKQYHDNKDLPIINEKFFLYALKTQGTRDTRGKKAKDDTLIKELETFYETEFKSLVDNDKFDLKNLSFLLQYIAIQMTTNYQTNIKEHYGQHLMRFINKTTSEDKIIRNNIKKGVIDNDKNNIPKEFHEWYDKHIKYIIPQDITKSLMYDLKANPDKFIKCLLYMNSVLEEKEHKLFQPLPLRNNIVPKYITLDTASLINFFAKKGKKGKLLSAVNDNKNLIWSQIFKLDKRVFKDKHYKFNHMIHTDGISVSLSFIRNDLIDKKYGSKSESIIESDYKYIEDFEKKELDELNKKNIVGVDPGKKFLVYMIDDNGNKLKYSSAQKRAESMGKRNTKILLIEKNKSKIIEKETKLSESNSKTINYDKFKDYIKEKTKLNNETRDFYIKDLWRKMKWRNYVYSRKSEDTFLNNIEMTFGKDCILAYGDWSRSTQMKNYMPTKNIGLRKIIHKRFQTISVGEYNSSKKCCDCYGDLEYVNKSKTVRHLKCPKCLSSENKKTVFRTRDANSAINMKNLFRYYCLNETRPKEFTRSSSVQNKNCEQNKVEQSVDFTERNGSN
jgi:hypothetical protein